MATSEEIIARYPVLFHMAERDSWPNIQKYGLLSTSALLDLFEVCGSERASIESEWRSKSVTIEHPIHGVAAIRDQGPMEPGTLAPLLENGLAPSDWYQLLNRKSFFWASKDRLLRLLNARLYRNRVHDVLTIDTHKLVERHSEHITLASFNTGVSSFGRKYRRGIDTFQSIEDFPMGTPSSEVVEVVVDYGVPDIAECTLAVEQWMGAVLQRTIWSSVHR